ncbi:unnamed protein product [Rhodiola kirilowii]
MEHVFAMTGQGSPKHQKTQFKKLVVKGPSTSQRRWKEKSSEQGELDPSTSAHKKSGKGKAKTNTGTVAKFDLSHPWDPNQ